MDLRSFSPANQGCLYDLGRLLDGVDLERIVFLVDGTTNREFLRSTLERLWSLSAPDSPNRARESLTAWVFPIDDRKPNEAWMPDLMERLLTVATATGHPAPPSPE